MRPTYDRRRWICRHRYPSYRPHPDHADRRELVCSMCKYFWWPPTNSRHRCLSGKALRGLTRIRAGHECQPRLRSPRVVRVGRDPEALPRSDLRRWTCTGLLVSDARRATDSKLPEPGRFVSLSRKLRGDRHSPRTNGSHRTRAEHPARVSTSVLRRCCETRRVLPLADDRFRAWPPAPSQDFSGPPVATLLLQHLAIRHSASALLRRWISRHRCYSRNQTRSRY